MGEMPIPGLAGMFYRQGRGFRGLVAKQDHVTGELA